MRSWPTIVVAMAVLSPAATAQAQGNGSPAKAEQPIPGAGTWVLQQRLPGIPGRVCTVRAAGPEANTTIVLNDDRRPVLIVARPDWSGLSGQADVSLAIDGAAPVTVSASMVHNLVLVLVSDDQLLQRLRGAETLDWTFPFGRYRAGVTGLGAALDTLTACRPDPIG